MHLGKTREVVVPGPTLVVMTTRLVSLLELPLSPPQQRARCTATALGAASHQPREE